MSCAVTKPLPKLSESDIKRFWSKVAITADHNKCWLWTAGTRRRGYGRFSFGAHMGLVSSRVSFIINNNIDPVGKLVAHRCDNPSCVNPKHLFLATDKENMGDKLNKNRSNIPYGDSHWNARIKAEDVPKIKSLYANGATQKEIADSYHIYQSVISRILNNKSWRNA